MNRSFLLRRFLRCGVLLPLAACILITVSPSYAQQAEGKAETGGGTGGEGVRVIKEPFTITVTARKGLEPALSIPVSVTAVTESTMEDADIRAVKQAADFAPNTFINQFTARALSNPFFRGIGGSPTNPGVSTFIDGVPQLNGFSSNIEMVDVGQIEFVRGPEGALYGRNTAGGVINIVSRPPSEVWSTQFQATFGNYDLRDFRGALSSPLLGEHFSFNLAGGYSERDGYTKNEFTGRDVDHRGAVFGKAQFFARLSERLKIRWIFTGERDRDGDYALGDVGYIRDNPHRVSRDFQGYTRRCVGSTTLRVEYQGSRVDFSSISGGLWWKNHSLTDLDYQTATLSNGGLYAIRENVDQQHQFTQEFRLASPRDRAVSLGKSFSLTWQAGVFTFKQNYQQDAQNDISSVFSFFPRRVSTSASDLNDWGMGIYGQAEFIAWKKLHITAGLRFDYEDKDARLGSSAGQNNFRNESFSETSPRFSVSYHHGANQMTYASAARGYKAGGFNPAPTGIPAPPGMESYGQEHTWNFEFGHKSRWLRDKLESSVALFYIEWNDLQLNQQIPFSGGQYFIANAGAANSKGIEAELRYFPFSWWECFGMVGYSRARFLGGSQAYNANLGINESIAGNTLPFTPTFNANVGTQISWAPSGRTRLYLRTQVTLSGDYMYDASNGMGQAGYSLTSFRGGVRGNHWFAEGWADNAFDTRYVPIAIPYAQLGAPSGYIGESGSPVTYGIRAGVHF